jgi:hypothetical protein
MPIYFFKKNIFFFIFFYVMNHPKLDSAQVTYFAHSKWRGSHTQQLNVKGALPEDGRKLPARCRRLGGFISLYPSRDSWILRFFQKPIIFYDFGVLNFSGPKK